jgi:hypothetical protein
MADLQGISAHGTIIEVEDSGPGDWVEIGELGDIVMPGLSRNEHDITSQNRDIDTYILGVLRREDVTFPMFFNAAIDSQLILREAIIANTTKGWRLTAPDGDVWIFSGGVKQMKQTNPVDGVQTANVSIRPTGKFLLNGDEVGG